MKQPSLLHCLPLLALSTACVAPSRPVSMAMHPRTVERFQPAPLPATPQGPVVIRQVEPSLDTGDRFVVGVQFGRRALEEDVAFAPLDDPFSFGFDLAFKPGPGPVAVEFGTNFAGRSNSGVDLTLGELFLGARFWLFPGNRLTPFVSLGGTLMTAEISQGAFGINQTSTGFYLRGGLYYRVNEFFSIGGEYRRVTGTEYDLEFAGVGGPNTNLDYGQWSAGFLFHF